MEVILGNTTSLPNKVNKVFNAVKTMNGAVNGEFDERNPVIDFNGGLNNINYAEINGLYYFIIGVSYPANGIMRVSFDLDLLMSYKSYITELEGVVERSSESPWEYQFEDDDIVISKVQERENIFIDHIPMSEFHGAYIFTVNTPTLRGSLEGGDNG